MADDFSNLKNYRDSLLVTTEDLAKIKTPTTPKPSAKIRFIITKNKNNSWVDDLHAQAQLNQMQRIYH